MQSLRRNTLTSLILVSFATVSTVSCSFIGTKRLWAMGEIQTKEESETGGKSLIVKVPDSALAFNVSPEFFKSVKEKSKICVEYSLNRMTKEVQVFSYQAKCQ
jgi:hypothetical protein